MKKRLGLAHLKNNGTTTINKATCRIERATRTNLNDLAQTIERRMPEVGAHQVPGDPPGLLTLGLHVDDQAQGRDERDEPLC